MKTAAIWLFVFALAFALDYVHAKYNLAVARFQAVRGANLSVILGMIGIVGTIAVLDDYWLFIPDLAGLWLGSYVAIRRMDQKKTPPSD